MKPKIPKMSKWMLKLWIKACEYMLRFYEGKETDGDCSFCAIAGPRGCDYGTTNCVWVWFTGMGCEDYTKKNYNTEVDKLKYKKHPESPRWYCNRKRQLPNWIKRLKEELCQKS